MRSLLLSSIALATSLVAQQTDYVVPAGYASQVGEGRIVGAFESGYAREVTTYDRAALGFGTGTIVELAWRRPVGTDALVGFTTALVVRLAHAANPPATMPYRFRDVVGPTPTIVFRGAVSMPSVAPATGLSPFAVVVPLSTPWSFDPALGHLAIDLETLSPFPATWPRDARDVRAGVPGTTRSIAGPCVNSTGFAMTQSATALDNVAPGRVLQVRVTGTLPTSASVFHWIGLPWSQPFDLTAIGAPGCTYAVEPLAVLPPVPVYPATSVFGWAWAEHAIPAWPGLIGARLATQWAELDQPPGNSLGVILSDALELTLGDATGVTVTAKTLRTSLPNVDVGQLVVGDRGAIVRVGVR